MAMLRKKPNKIREPFSDRVLQGITTCLLIAVVILVGYPLLYVISCSFSSANALSSGRVLLWPVEPTLAGYQFVFRYKPVWLGYRNSIFYTVAGTSITMFLQILMAYPLSKRNYQGRGLVTKILLVAMMTSAGLIPTYLLKRSLGLTGTVWAVILAGAVGISNVFILRTAFRSSIPGELFDAAKIDGAGEFQCLVKIAIPLSKATLSVLVLYAAVGAWNDYFNAMIYLRDSDLYPLQLILRSILTSTKAIDTSSMTGSDMAQMASSNADQIRYALILVATVPVLAMYAVVQRYFEKGVMIGSVKG